VSTLDAVEIGLADATVLDHASALAGSAQLQHWLANKVGVRDHDEQRRPLETYRVRELAEMSQDIFDDRSSFAAARAPAHGTLLPRDG
jgi:putative two-component system protein, hydrogenase maturation factor HypX/HoxX